jgi:hypothetical protein
MNRLHPRQAVYPNPAEFPNIFFLNLSSFQLSIPRRHGPRVLLSIPRRTISVRSSSSIPSRGWPPRDTDRRSRLPHRRARRWETDRAASIQHDAMRWPSMSHGGLQMPSWLRLPTKRAASPPGLRDGLPMASSHGPERPRPLDGCHRPQDATGITNSSL